MKRGRKKPGSFDSDSKMPGGVTADISTAETEEADTFTLTSEPSQSGRFSIDGVRGLMAIALGLAVVEIVWLVLHIT